MAPRVSSSSRARSMSSTSEITDQSIEADHIKETMEHITRNIHNIEPARLLTRTQSEQANEKNVVDGKHQVTDCESDVDSDEYDLLNPFIPLGQKKPLMTVDKLPTYHFEGTWSDALTNTGAAAKSVGKASKSLGLAAYKTSSSVTQFLGGKAIAKAPEIEKHLSEGVVRWFKGADKVGRQARERHEEAEKKKVKPMPPTPDESEIAMVYTDVNRLPHIEAEEEQRLRGYQKAQKRALARRAQQSDPSYDDVFKPSYSPYDSSGEEEDGNRV